MIVFRWIPGGQYDPNNPNLYKDSFGNTYEWDAKKQTWKTKNIIVSATVDSAAQSKNSTNNISDEKISEKNNLNVEKDTGTKTNNTSTNSENKDNVKPPAATYTHPETGVIYKWNQEKWVWQADDGSELKPATETQTASAEKKSAEPGTAFFWDQEKKQWVEDTDQPEPEKQKKKKASMFNKRKASEAG